MTVTGPFSVRLWGTQSERAAERHSIVLCGNSVRVHVLDMVLKKAGSKRELHLSGWSVHTLDNVLGMRLDCYLVYHTSLQRIWPTLPVCITEKAIKSCLRLRLLSIIYSTNYTNYNISTSVFSHTLTHPHTLFSAPSAVCSLCCVRLSYQPRHQLEVLIVHGVV